MLNVQHIKRFKVEMESEYTLGWSALEGEHQ